MDEAATQETAQDQSWISAALEFGVLGVELWRVLTAFALLAAAVLLRRPAASLARRGVDYVARRTRFEIDDRVGPAIEPPLGLCVIAIAAFAGIQVMRLDGMAAEIGASVDKTLFAIAVFWALYRLTPLFGALMRGWTRVMTPEIAGWIERIVKAAIWLVAGATILELWGVRVAPIIAGFGLVGVAVALGAQDLFRNLISGALILTEKRFRVGDWIKVDGVVEGTVEAISLRSTKVRRFDKAPVYLPNTVLADGAVTNFGEMTHRRIFWRVGLEYRSSADQLQTIRDKIEAFIREDGRFLTPPDGTLLVRIDQFADSSIDLLIYCFTKTRDWADWLAIKEELLLFVKASVEAVGTGIAFPSRSLYVESGAEAALLPAAQPAAEARAAPAKKAAAGAKSGSKPAARGGRKTGARAAASKTGAASTRTRKAKTGDKGPEDGPVDGLSDAPEDEDSGPAAARA